jgi:hypothetical protein
MVKQKPPQKRHKTESNIMAHRIEKHDKQEGTTQGWHGLTVIREIITLADNWLRQWEILPVRLDKRGQPSKWTILECSDVPELEIGQPYNPDTFHPVNNADFLRLVGDSIGGTGHEIVSVGSVRNRGRVFVSIRLNGMDKFKAAGREFSAFLNFGNGHDKSSVLWVNTSNTCTVCDNTFSANLFSVEDKSAKQTGPADDVKMRLRHTKNAEMRFPALATLIDKAVGVQAEFALELDRIAKVEIAPVVAQDIFAGFIGRNVSKADLDKGLSSRARNTVTRLSGLFADAKQGNSGRNLADAFNAVTDYYTHESSGGEDKGRQFLSSEYGAGQVAKSEFWQTVRDETAIETTIARGQVLLAAKGALVKA